MEENDNVKLASLPKNRKEFSAALKENAEFGFGEMEKDNVKFKRPLKFPEVLQVGKKIVVTVQQGVKGGVQAQLPQAPLPVVVMVEVARVRKRYALKGTQE